MAGHFDALTMSTPRPILIDLSGRTALITGASKGLGYATALKMAQSGAHVAILARGQDELQAAQARINALAPQGRAVAVRCDLTDATDLEAGYRSAREALGPIDILINNVGGHALGTFLEITDAMWDHDINVKLHAQIRMTRLCWPDMLARKWGRVMSTLNTLARAPAAGSAPTSVTRAAQLALTKVLSKEGAPHNVLVNALLVGLIESDQLSRYQSEADAGRAPDRYSEAMIRQRVPLQRMGEAREFADLACFLASDSGSYITGCAINVDGGMSPVA